MIEMIGRDLSNDLYVVPTEAEEEEGDRGGVGRPHHPPPPAVLVHCLDGASQCGLFVACYVVCQKMALDGQVDVFHSIQQMKKKRFHFISSVVSALCTLSSVAVSISLCSLLSTEE